MTTPERIRKGFAANGITPAEAARRLGVTHQAMHMVLSGRRPGRKHLPALAIMLGTTVEWLANGTGPEPTWALQARVDQLKREYPIATKRGPGIIPQVEAEPPPPWAADILSALRSLRSELTTRLDRLDARLDDQQDDTENPITEAEIEELERLTKELSHGDFIQHETPRSPHRTRNEPAPEPRCPA